eukprot:5496455-Amphidinium_carterae.1
MHHKNGIVHVRAEDKTPATAAGRVQGAVTAREPRRAGQCDISGKEVCMFKDVVCKNIPQACWINRRSCPHRRTKRTWSSSATLQEPI